MEGFKNYEDINIRVASGGCHLCGSPELRVIQSSIHPPSPAPARRDVLPELCRPTASQPPYDTAQGRGWAALLCIQNTAGGVTIHQSTFRVTSLEIQKGNEEEGLIC